MSDLIKGGHNKDSYLIHSVEYLKRIDFVRALINYDKVLNVEITGKGKNYYENRHRIDAPIIKELQNLTKQNLELQNEELEYRKQIRKQESIIRLWKVIAAILGIISVTLWIISYMRI